MQSICSRALLVLSLVSIAVPASAEVIEGTSNDGAAAAAVVPEGATGVPPASASASAPVTVTTAPTTVPRVQTISLGFLYGGTFFHTENTDNYRFHGPGLTVDYFVGRRWGFALHVGVSFPLHGAETGPNNQFNGGLGGTGKYDGGRMAIDTNLMVARRMPLTDKLTLFYGFGVNVTTIKLASSQFSPIELIAGGIGAMARIDYALTSLLFLSGQLNAAIDPMDFIRHTNRAVLTNPVSGSISLGFRF